MRKDFLLAVAVFVIAATSSVAASSVKYLNSGDPSFVLIEATIDAGDTILTPVIPLGKQGDLVPAEGLVVEGSSSAAVAVNVDLHVSSESQGVYFEVVDDEIALSGASPQVGSSDLDDMEPFVKLELENAGAAQAVVKVSYWLTERFAADEKRGSLLDRDPSLAKAKTLTLVATTGTDSTAALNVVGKNRLALYFEPSATGLTYDLDGRAVTGGSLLSIASGVAVGAADVRAEVDLSDWGVKEVILTVDNPTGGDIDLTYSAVGLP